MKLNNLFENENVTIKSLAEEVKVNYNVLLKKSKDPIEGKVYDATEVNYEAMAAYIEKLSENCKSIEEYNFENYIKKQEEKASEKRVGSIINDIEKYTLGTQLTLRDKITYCIVYKTDSQIVLESLTESGAELRLLSVATFFHQLPHIIEA